jgi:hypothetical protein
LKIAAPIILASAFAGFGFMVLPHSDPIFVLALAKNQIEPFMPMTMQFSALDISDEGDLLAAIDRINKQTENDAVIVGAKDWRGFMDLHLKAERTYKFGNDIQAIALAQVKTGKDVYILSPTMDYQRFNLVKIENSTR